jgi:hypothetical protein
MYRVTRLAEFSPIGRLFTLGGFLKITEVAHSFGDFFPSTSYVLILTKKGQGHILGDFSPTRVGAML